MIDVEKEEWKSLPIMSEGRDLRNKVVFADGCAYAVGGLNRKAEKFNFQKRTWSALRDYPIIDNLDSWACAMTFLPQRPDLPSLSSSSSIQEKELGSLLDQERIIDREIQEEIEKYRLSRDMGFEISSSMQVAASEEEEDREQMAIEVV